MSDNGKRKTSLQFNPFKKKKQDIEISEPRDFRQGVHIEEVEGMLQVRYLFFFTTF